MCTWSFTFPVFRVICINLYPQGRIWEARKWGWSSYNEQGGECSIATQTPSPLQGLSPPCSCDGRGQSEQHWSWGPPFRCSKGKMTRHFCQKQALGCITTVRPNQENWTWLWALSRVLGKGSRAVLMRMWDRLKHKSALSSYGRMGATAWVVPTSLFCLAEKQLHLESRVWAGERGYTPTSEFSVLIPSCPSTPAQSWLWGLGLICLLSILFSFISWRNWEKTGLSFCPKASSKIASFPC